MILVWLYQDLRLSDNPALQAAAEKGKVLPLYINAPEEEGNWPIGPAAKQWRDASLDALGVEVFSGPSLETLMRLAKKYEAEGVYWNHRYEPALWNRDQKIKQALEKAGLKVRTFRGSLLREPWDTLNKSGQPYQVFTPFYKTLSQEGPFPPLSMGKPGKGTVGEAAAHQHCLDFVKEGLADYPEGGSSKLSPHLHFGEISSRQVWHLTKRREPFVRELIWREFAYHLLFHFPHTPDQPLREEFAKFPWKNDAKALAAWKAGETGYPIVDAAMRQLAQEGWMHNRLRMVVASFLTKDLLIPWQEGARWFWERLIDADLANNTLGWQWTAGCGADAAPYFRIFNPTTQGQKFDPDGTFIKQWVPELKDVPPEEIHTPTRYIPPIVDHAQARDRALKAFDKIKGKK